MPTIARAALTLTTFAWCAACDPAAIEPDAGAFVVDDSGVPEELDGGRLATEDAGVDDAGAFEDAGLVAENDPGEVAPGDAGDVSPVDGGQVDDSGVADDNAGVATTTVSFLHYNDFHANLTSHLDWVRSPASPGGATVQTRGGAARLATLLHNLREALPHTVAMNIGDTFHGGVEALYTDGEAVYDVVDALQFDIGVPGNWDFAFGPNVSWVRYRTTGTVPALFANSASDIRPVGFEHLAANVVVDADNTGTLTGPLANQFRNALAADDGQHWLPPTSTRTFGDVKVGFIGLTSDFVPRMHPTMAMGLSFVEGREAYIDLVEQHAADLRAEGCHVVVVMSELGVHKDVALADAIGAGWVDVFFSAHTHEITSQPVVSTSGALVVEAGNDGLLGQLDLDVVNGVVAQSHWTLHDIDDALLEDDAVALAVSDARAPFVGDNVNVVVEEGFMPNPLAGRSLTRSIETPIGETPHTLRRRNALESSFNNYFTDLLRDYTGADVALSPGFRYEVPLLVGEAELGAGVVADGQVHLEDAYRFFPAPYTLGVGTLDDAGIEDILENLLDLVFAPDTFRQEGGWVDGFSGLDATVDLSAPFGERVQSLSIPGPGVGGRTVAGCRRPFDDGNTMCSYDGFADVTDVVFPDTGLPMTPVELLEWGLQRPAEAQPSTRQSIIDASETPQWPVSTFVQPLRGVGTAP